MVVRPIPVPAESRTPEPSEVAREIASLELQASDAAESLQALTHVRTPWGLFVPPLRKIVQESAGKAWPMDDPLVRPRILQADMDRLKLKSQIGNLAVISDPLAQLLRTTLRQPLDGLYMLFGRREGSTFVPFIDPDRFEWVIAESEGILDDAERRVISQRDRALKQANLLQRQLNDSREHELQRLELEHVSLKGLWKRLTGTTVGKFLTWTIVTLLAGILTAYGVPALAIIAETVWRWVRARLSI